MATDRFIYFDKIPPKKEVKQILEDYIEESGKVTWQEGRWHIMLAGDQSFPFKRVRPDMHMASFMAGRERWIEIHRAKKNIDVITRQADEYTNNVALGIAYLLARYYKGRFEEEGLVQTEHIDSDFMVGKDTRIVLTRGLESHTLAEHPDRVIVKKSRT